MADKNGPGSRRAGGWSKPGNVPENEFKDTLLAEEDIRMGVFAEQAVAADQRRIHSGSDDDWRFAQVMLPRAL